MIKGILVLTFFVSLLAMIGGWAGAFPSNGSAAVCMTVSLAALAIVDAVGRIGEPKPKAGVPDEI